MRSGPRVWWLVAAVAFAFMAPIITMGAHPAHAAKPDVVKAREHARKGDALLKLEKYREALAEFEAAYVGDSEPTALFNIARCHELLGDVDAAARFYRRYLDEAPHGRLRPYAQKRVATLEHPVLVPIGDSTAPAPAPGKLVPPGAPSAPVSVKSAPTVATAPAKPAPTVATAPAKPAPTAAPAPVKPAAPPAAAKPAPAKAPPAVATAPAKPAASPPPAPAKPTVAAAPAPAKPAPAASAPPAAPSNGGYTPIGEPRLVKASEVKPAPAPAPTTAPAPARVALAPSNPPPSAQAVLATGPAPADKSDAKDQGSHGSHWLLWTLLIVGVSAGAAAAYIITQRSAPEPPCPATRMCQ
jgi:hypothetical protein